jgi:hypothetical protein
MVIKKKGKEASRKKRVRFTDEEIKEINRAFSNFQQWTDSGRYHPTFTATYGINRR